MLEERKPHGLERYIGAGLISSDEVKVGEVDGFVLNRLTEVSEWFVVKAGLLGGRTYFVPVAGSDFGENVIAVPYTGEHIHGEPEVDASDASLSPEDEALLEAHFGLGSVTVEPGEET